MRTQHTKYLESTITKYHGKHSNEVTNAYVGQPCTQSESTMKTEEQSHKCVCRSESTVKHSTKVITANVGQRVVLNFVNFSKARALYRCGMTPLVRSASHPQWARLPPSNCFYYKSPRHRTSNVLSVLFTIDRSFLACFGSDLACAYMCACAYVFVCLCVRARARACVRVCVCVCVLFCMTNTDAQN